jgi:type I restriction enzyme M protein
MNKKIGIFEFSDSFLVFVCQELPWYLLIMWLLYSLLAIIIPEKNKKGKEVDKGWTCDLIPNELVVNRFLAQEKKELDDFEALLESKDAEITSMQEEHGGDEGPLNEVTKIGEAKENLIEYSELAYAVHFPELNTKRKEQLKTIESETEELLSLENHSLFDGVKNAKGKITQKAIKDRLKVLEESDDETTSLNSWVAMSKLLASSKKELKVMNVQLDEKIHALIDNNEKGEYIEDIQLLITYIDLHTEVAVLKKELKVKVTELDELTLAKFKTLSEAEVRILVVEDKWLASLQAAIQTEIDAISQRLTGRIKELANRYENTMGELDSQTQTMEEKVATHLENMGLVWN